VRQDNQQRENDANEVNIVLSLIEDCFHALSQPWAFARRPLYLK
jgi:hypothetical protein